MASENCTQEALNYTELENCTQSSPDYTEIVASVHAYFFFFPEANWLLCDVASSCWGVACSFGRCRRSCASATARTTSDDPVRSRKLLEMLPVPTQTPSWRIDQISAISGSAATTVPSFFHALSSSDLTSTGCQRHCTMPSVKILLVAVLCLLICFAEIFITARLWH